MRSPYGSTIVQTQRFDQCRFPRICLTKEYNTADIPFICIGNGIFRCAKVRLHPHDLRANVLLLYAAHTRISSAIHLDGSRHQFVQNLSICVYDNFTRFFHHSRQPFLTAHPSRAHTGSRSRCRCQSPPRCSTAWQGRIRVRARCCSPRSRGGLSRRRGSAAGRR